MSRIGRAVISSDDVSTPAELPASPAILPVNQGGTGQDTSATTGTPELRAGTWYFPQNNLNVLMFGATGDGTTDDRAAIQAAIDAAPTGGALYFPPGAYRINAALHIDKSLRLFGDCHPGGSALSRLSAGSGTEHMFHIASDDPVMVERLAFFPVAGVTRSAGAAIYVEGATALGNFKSSFRDLTILEQYDGIRIAEAAQYTISGCYINTCSHYGIHCANDLEPDNGGGMISQNVFDSTSHLGGSAIFIEDGGGIRIIDNQILNYAYGIELDIKGTTSVLNIVGNTIEKQGGAGVFIHRTGGVATWAHVTITANEFALFEQFGVCIDTAGCANVIVSANTFSLIAGDIYGINFQNVTDAMAIGNAMSGSGAGNIGVSFGAAAVNTVAADNHMVGIATHYENLNVSPAPDDWAE